MPGLVALMTLPIPNQYVHLRNKSFVYESIHKLLEAVIAFYFDSGNIIVIQGFVYMKDLPLGVNIQPKITFAAPTSRSQISSPSETKNLEPLKNRHSISHP